MNKSKISKLRKFFSIIKSIKSSKYEPLYEVVEIIEEEDEFSATIRITNKNVTFFAKPEEILANDSLVDKFSSRDIRALTYLGYLGLNRPKYKILAQKLSKNEKIVFLIKKKGEKKILIKTAAEINLESNMISDMTSEDAKLIGYTIASDNISKEQEMKLLLIDNKNKDTSNNGTC